jgi:hypothetical protein
MCESLQTGTDNPDLLILNKQSRMKHGCWIPVNWYHGINFEWLLITFVRRWLIWVKWHVNLVRRVLKLALQLPVQSVPITTKVVSSNPVHGKVYSIQHYVIKFISDLQQISGFLWACTAFNVLYRNHYNIQLIQAFGMHCFLCII